MDGVALGSLQPRPPPLGDDDELLDEIPTLADLLKEQARLRRAIDPEELFTSVCPVGGHWGLLIPGSRDEPLLTDELAFVHLQHTSKEYLERLSK